MKLLHNFKKKMNKPNSALSGVVWKFAERVLAQGISFIVSIVLARLLMPSEYGIIALVLIFINIANAFVTNGLGLSLIQKKNADETDFSTIFYCSILLGIILYILVFVSAPLIATFFKNDLLCPVTRILGLILILASINSIQQAYVSKKLLFQKFFFATLSGTIISGIVGVGMAYMGFGVWALVTQYLVNYFIRIVSLFIAIDWRPKLLFSIEKSKLLFRYAWKLMVSGFINTSFSQIKNLIIGKLYTVADLAFYEKGNYFPQIVINNLNSAISDVLFPYMAKNGDNILEIKRFARRSLKSISYMVTPCIIGLILVAHNLVIVLLSEKWIGSVLYLQIMSIYWLTQPLQTVNWQALKAIGRSDLCLKLEIVKKGISIIALLTVMKISVTAIAITSVALAVMSAILNAIPVNILIGYTYREQIIDILPSSILSLVMGIAVYLVSFIKSSSLIMLIVQCFVGLFIYILLSSITKNPEFLFLKNKVVSIINKRKL